MLLDLLQETAEVLARRVESTGPGEPPRWYRDIARWLVAAPGPATGGVSGLWPAIASLVEETAHEVQRAAAALLDTVTQPLVDAGQATAFLMDMLPEELIGLASRTLALELHVARLRGDLSGSTPQERFANFMASFADASVRQTFWLEYPVLARQLVEHARQAAATHVEFLRHLVTDWPLISDQFGEAASAGALCALNARAGDAHHGGRTVRVLGFASGWKLVYKPRSLAADVTFQRLLAWLNEAGLEPPLRTVGVLDRGDHGWIEFVTPQTCQSTAAVGRFYQRIGMLLALFHTISANDMHFENLIAAGEQPVVVDLETILLPERPRPRLDRPDQELAYTVLVPSVLDVGLLPFRVGARGDEAGADLSGLAAVKGQPSPVKVATWEGVGTDALRLRRQHLPMPGAHNRPTLGDQAVDLWQYSAELCAGFDRAYRFLATHREALLQAHGPLAAAADVEVRVVLRPTRVYGQLLGESFHPDFLRDALDRDCFFDALWLGTANGPHLEQVIEEEQADLWAGDIPRFTTRPGSRDLWSSRGQCFPDFFKETALASIARRLRAWDEADLARQQWLIRATLGSLAASRDLLQWKSYPIIEPQTLVPWATQQRRLVAAARRIGDRLAREAAILGDHAIWLGLNYRHQHWSLETLGEDLYGGVTGVILFLAYLSAQTGDEQPRMLAQRAYATLRSRLMHPEHEAVGLGAFTGWGGLIYLAMHLAVLWDDAALLDEATARAAQLGGCIESDHDLDVIGGSAGTLVVLLGLAQLAPESDALTMARALGEHLLGRAEPVGQGLAWRTRLGKDTPLTGFSHGAGGIAWTLARLSERLGDERFLAAAHQGMAWEREALGRASTLTETEPGNEDRRDQALALGWCYGVPGIGLARLAARSATASTDPVLQREIDEALARTVAHGFGRNHSLCHGDLGNAELLLQAALAPDGARWRREVERVAEIVLASIERYGWLCGTPLGVDSPGLMTGLAGIGMGLLRVAAPEQVPSILTLDPPPPGNNVRRRGA